MKKVFVNNTLRESIDFPECIPKNTKVFVRLPYSDIDMSLIRYRRGIEVIKNRDITGIHEIIVNPVNTGIFVCATFRRAGFLGRLNAVVREVKIAAEGNRQVIECWRRKGQLERLKIWRDGD